MKKIISLMIIAATLVCLCCSCGKIKPEAEDLNVVVTEDPTRLRTIFGTVSEDSAHFIYEVINPYEKNADGSDKIDGSYEIYTDKETVEAALKEKALLSMNERGYIVVNKFPDLTGGDWVLYINGRKSKKDITKLPIETGATYSFKYIAD